MLEELRVRVWLAVRGYGWRRDVRWVDEQRPLAQGKGLETTAEGAS